MTQRAALGATHRTSHCRLPARELQWLIPASPGELLLTLVLLWFSTTVAASPPTLVVLVLVLMLELLLTLLLDVTEAAIAGCSRRQSRKAAVVRDFMVLTR